MILFAWIVVPISENCGKSFAANPGKSTTSRAARENAEQLIPYAKLDETAKKKIKSVVNWHSVFRRLPVEVNQCDPDLYLFLLKHPEVIVNIWDVMGISNVKMDRIDDRSFKATDGAGTTCVAETLYQGSTTHVVYAEGEYVGPVFKRPISARCVLLLKSNFMQTAEGKVYVTNRLDAFVRMDKMGAELVAKIVHPLVGNVADHNFRETAAFLGRLSEVSATKPEGMARLVARLEDIDESTRSEFSRLTFQVAKRMMQRRALPSKEASFARRAKVIRTSAQ